MFQVTPDLIKLTIEITHHNKLSKTWHKYYSISISQFDWSKKTTYTINEAHLWVWHEGVYRDINWGDKTQHKHVGTIHSME